MYILFMASFFISSSLFCSTPQPQKSLDRGMLMQMICKQPVAKLHTEISPLLNNKQIWQFDHSAEIQSELFFACLPQELRMLTLSQNFFNGDLTAAKQFETREYVWSLYLLAEYQQKPHPYLHLQPKWIFLLRPEQVTVINDIEQQHIKSLNTAPAAPVITSWFFLNRPSADAQLTYNQLEILKAIPPKALEFSLLNKKTITYSDSLQEPHHLILDTVKSCIFDTDNHIVLAKVASVVNLVGSCIKAGRSVMPYFFPNYKLAYQEFIILNNANFIQGAITSLLGHNIIPWPCNNFFKSYVCIHTGIDLVGLGVCAAQYGRATALSKIFLTSFPALGIAAIFTSGLVFVVRSSTPYPNRYSIESNKKKRSKTWCTLV